MAKYSADSIPGNKTVVAGTAFDLADMQFIHNGRRCFPFDLQEFRVTSFGYFSGDDPLSFEFPILMIQIAALIFANRLVYYLLRPLKQPRIVSDLIGGLLMSQNVLGLVHYSGYNELGELIKRPVTDILYPESDFPIIRTIASFGTMLYLFLIGVKLDPYVLLSQSGKKHWVIGFASFIVPLISFGFAFFGFQYHVAANDGHGHGHGYFLIFAVTSFSLTAFPVVADILTELNLLNSELGRVAMSSSLVHGVFGFICKALFVAMNQGQGGWEKALFSFLSFLALTLVILFVFRPWTQWIVGQTRKGNRIEETHIFVIFIVVIAMGMMSDFIGASFVYAPFLMGLAVPDGPPLGAALTEKVQMLVSEVMFPLFFGVSGLSMNLKVFRQWKKCLLLVAALSSAYVAKIVGTMVAAIYYEMTLQNAFLLGLMMNFRGVVELLTFIHLRFGHVFSDEIYTLFILVTIAGTSIVVPLVSFLYKPLADGYILGRRAIQHLKPHAELRILVCLQSEDPITSLINLLDVSSPNEETPLCIYVLYLKKLVGRVISTLTSHKNNKGFIDPSSQMDSIHNVFLNYELSKSGYIAVQPYTSTTPTNTMHQDICWLAAEKNVALVIVPFQKKHKATAMDLDLDQAIRNNLPTIQTQAPCSIGILIYPSLIVSLTTQTSTKLLQHHVAILFWGGQDDREALTYASRMVRRPSVSLTIYNFSLEEDRRDMKERKLDEHLLASVQFENAYSNRFKVVEIVAQDEEHTIKTIRSIGDGFNLLMVGRRQGANSLLLDEGLAEWAEFPELGVVGDMLASSDFEGGSSSVLVVQNQA